MTKALIWILPIIFVISGCAEPESSGGGGVLNPGGGGTGSAPSGVLAINWVAPTEREDGTPLILSEIETYNLYYGSSPGDYQNTIDNSTVTTDSVYITNFLSGTYYFVVTTVTYDGMESRFSEEIEIII
jgi:hypothetical protein